MKPDNANTQIPSRKIQDKAVLIPLIGLLFLMPPIAGIFQIETTIGGIPFTLLYLFVVWAGLIAGTCLLSRSLNNIMPDRPTFDQQTEDRLP